MQPAPLTASPPIKINPTNEALGGADGVSQRDHPAGINKMSRPDGLFQRSNSIQGRRPEVLLFTGNEIQKRESRTDGRWYQCQSAAMSGQRRPCRKLGPLS